MLRTKKKKNQSTSSVNKLLLFEMDCNQNSLIIDLSLDEVSGLPDRQFYNSKSIYRWRKTEDEVYFKPASTKFEK